MRISVIMWNIKVLECFFQPWQAKCLWNYHLPILNVFQLIKAKLNSSELSSVQIFRALMLQFKEHCCTLCYVFVILS